MRFASALLGWVVAAGLLSQAVMPAAFAQSTAPSSTASTKPAAAVGSQPDRPFTFDAIQGVITPDQPLKLTLTVGPGKALKDPKIQVSIYQRIHDRKELEALVIDPGIKGGHSGFIQDLEPIAEGESRTVNLTRSYDELLLNKLDVKGVYLLEITLKDDYERVTFLRSPVVVPPESSEVRGAIVGALGQTDRSVIVESKDDLPTQALEILPTPAYDADLLGLVETGQDDVLVRAVTEGIRERQLPADQASADTSRSRVMAAPSPIDRRIADLVHDVSDLKGILVPAGSLGTQETITRRRSLLVFSGDTSVTTAANKLDGAALGQWMAAYAALPDYIRRPGDYTSRPDPLTLEEKKRGKTDIWPEAAPSPVLLDLRTVQDPADQQTLTQALSALPWVQVGKVSELVPKQMYELPDATFEHPRVTPARKTYFQQLADARAALPALLAMTDKRSFEDGTNPQHFDQELLEAASIHTQESPAAERVLETLKQVKDGIHVLSPPPITMTGSQGIIPIPVVNDSAIPLDVQVRVISTNLEIEGPSVMPMRLRAKDATTKDVVVAPRTSGGLTSALVQVENPKTGEIITTGAISVRSTAYPFTALLFAAGAIGVLMLWGWRNRPNRLRATPKATPEDQADQAVHESVEHTAAQDEPVAVDDPTQPLTGSAAAMETTEPIDRTNPGSTRPESTQPDPSNADSSDADSNDANPSKGDRQ